MRRSQFIPALTTMLALALNPALPRPAHAAWGVDGAVVCNAANGQLGVVALSDGGGGAYVAWVDFRFGSSSPQVFGQHLSPTGVGLWTANGLVLAAGGLLTNDVAMTSDGAGGVIVAWSQGDPADRGNDIYAQRLNPAGVSQWTAGGVPICAIHGTAAAPKNKLKPTLCPDGAGGAFIAWEDGRAAVSTRDIYAQHVNASGVVQWVVDGVAVCTNPFQQLVPVITSGAAGTAVVVWLDPRNGNQDLFAQRINDPAGAVSWTANGVAVCNAVGTQGDLRTLADGSGAYAAWSDERTGVGQYNAYLQRLDAATGAGLLGGNGMLISTVGSGYKLRPSLVASGSGTLVAWQDHRNTFDDIYAQRFDAAGNQLWTAGGVRMTDLPNHQEYATMAPDGAGGAFVASRDLRPGTTVGMVGHIDSNGNLLWPINGTFTNTTSPTNPGVVVADGVGGAIFAWDGTANNNVFAQRIVASSNLADYDVVVSAVSDLPGDEGGFVRITTPAAIGDWAPGTPPVTGYNVWRQIPAGPAARPEDFEGAHRRGVETLAAAAPGALLDPLAAETVGFPAGSWESLGLHASLGLSSYTFAVGTPTDSSALGAANRSYVLTVHTTVPSVFAVSNIRSGHSVDNLAPGAPQNLVGQKTGATTVQLDWSANPEGDLAHYAVYRGASAGFTPGPGNRIGTPTAPALTDPGFAMSFYKVSAIDRHGNESAFALLDPGTFVGVPGPGTPQSSSFGIPAPNPLTTATTVDLTLAASGHASVRVFDTGGRRVRTLFDGGLDAGEHPVTWDGRDSRGHAVASGVYLVEAEFAGTHWSRRVLVAR